MSKSNSAQFEGEYWNLSPANKSILWRELVQSKSFKKISYPNLGSTWVRLHLTADTMIHAQFIRSDSLIESLVIKRRVENNYFIKNQLSSRVFLPPLYWRNWNHQLVLGLDSKCNLIAVGLGYSEGSILFIVGSGGGRSELVFELKKT